MLRRVLSILVLSLLLWPSGVLAESSQARREGLTFSAGFGVGYQVFVSDFEEQLELGFPSLAMSLGQFLSERLALILSYSAQIVSFDDTDFVDNVSVVRLASELVVGVQLWTTELLKIEFGAGVAIVNVWVDELDFDGQPTGDTLSDSDTGVALTMGAAVPFWSTREQSFQAGIQWGAGFYSEGSVHNLSLNVIWQLY